MGKYNILNAGKRLLIPYYAYAVLTGNPRKTRFGIGGPHFLTSRDEFFSFNFVMEHEDTLRLTKRYLKNKKLMDHFKKYCFDGRKKIERTLKVKDAGKLSVKDMIGLYQKYMDLSADVFSTVRVLRMLDKGGVELLREMLRNRGDIEEAITLLTAPEEYSFIMEEEINIIKKGLKIKDKADIKRAAERLYGKYACMTKGWHLEPSREIKFYEESLRKVASDKENARKRLEEIEESKRKSIAERKRLEKELKLSKDEKHLAKILRDAVFLKDYTKISNMYAAYLFDPVFAEMAKRTGLTLKEIKTLWYLEVKELLENGKLDKSILEKRLKRFFAIGDEEGIREYYGKDADAMEEEYLGKPEKITQNEFRGRPASKGFGKGKARIIFGLNDLNNFKEGEVLIAPNTTPDFVPAMKKAAAIIAEEGGITSHAAVISRELGVPCVVGIENAPQIFKNGDILEVDADKGVIRVIKRQK